VNAAGAVRGGFPSVRFGRGPAALVVLPGMVFDNAAPRAATAHAWAWGMRRLSVGRAVTVLQRPHGVADRGSTGPDGHRVLSTEDLADVYAPVIADEFGAVDVMALSTGGLIAQHLALRHSALVRRLILVVSGARIADAGRQLCRTWLDQAEREDWRSLRGSLAASAVDGPVATRLARLVGSGRAPDQQDVKDFRATVDAVLRHDTMSVLTGITAPTLLLGGRDDPFFPEAVLRSTAAQIRGARLQVHEGGHGVPKHHSRWLQNHVTTFLAGDPSRMP
jgi:pimeloyl-ACP methyl ester carboxylesterase